MGPQSYMRSVVDRNVVMRSKPVHSNFKLWVLSYEMWCRVAGYVPTFQEDHISYISRVIHLVPMMQAAGYSNTALYNYKTTRRHIPENILIRSVRPSFLKFWHMKLTYYYYYYYYYYYSGYSALGPVWAETRAQSGDWYGSGMLHPGQVLRGSLPLLSPGKLTYDSKISLYTLKQQLTLCRYDMQKESEEMGSDASVC